MTPSGSRKIPRSGFPLWLCRFHAFESFALFSCCNQCAFDSVVDRTNRTTLQLTGFILRGEVVRRVGAFRKTVESVEVTDSSSVGSTTKIRYLGKLLSSPSHRTIPQNHRQLTEPLEPSNRC